LKGTPKERSRMPIRDLQEIKRLPRLGKIKLGTKTEGEKGYPKAADHFIAPEPVRNVYGERPKSLKIVFPTDDNPDQWLRCYSASRGLICKGDGERAVRLVDKKTGKLAGAGSEETELVEVQCEYENCEEYKRKRCRRVMCLQFMLPDVKGFGIWQLDTSSFYSIVNINSTISMLRDVIGRISFVPLELKLQPKEVQVEGRKKVIHVLQLEAPYSLAEMMKISRIPKEKLILPPPEVEKPPEDLYPEEILEEEEKNSRPEEKGKAGQKRIETEEQIKLF